MDPAEREWYTIRERITWRLSTFAATIETIVVSNQQLMFVNIHVHKENSCLVWWMHYTSSQELCWNIFFFFFERETEKQKKYYAIFTMACLLRSPKFYDITDQFYHDQMWSYSKQEFWDLYLLSIFNRFAVNHTFTFNSTCHGTINIM